MTGLVRAPENGVASGAAAGAFVAAVNDAEERLTRLEERFTHLQRHVGEQDRVILDLTAQLDGMRRDLIRLQGESTGGRGGNEDMPADERPPHY